MFLDFKSEDTFVKSVCQVCRSQRQFLKSTPKQLPVKQLCTHLVFTLFHAVYTEMIVYMSEEPHWNVTVSRSFS